MGAWEVEYVWPAEVSHGGPRRVVITAREGADPAETARGISSTVVRQLDFAEAQYEWRVKRANVTDENREFEKLILNHLRGHGLTDSYLTQLSRVYIVLVNDGVSNVSAALAEMIDKSPNTVKAHLKEARSRGLLTSVAGKTGGELTPKGSRIATKNIHAFAQSMSQHLKG